MSFRGVWQFYLDESLKCLLLLFHSLHFLHYFGSKEFAGVGISNHNVKFQAAETIMICNLDYYIRHHLANNDSHHNEVERVQSFVGDMICDGGTIDWEKKRV